MKNRSPYLVLACLTVIFSGAAAAESVKIPVGQQGQEYRDVPRPARGITKSKVESSYGAPSMKSTPVGEPPVSYWEYDRYYVYFEKDRVLHTVLKKGGSEQ